MQTVRTIWDGPVYAYPHHGVFEIPNWRYDNTLSAELPAVIPGKENPNGQGERCPGARASQ